MHSKDEPLFRVGSIYRDGYGDLVRILRLVGEDVAACIGFCGGRWDEYTFNFRLSDGKWLGSDLKERCDLIPGEVDESGNPTDSDGLSDALSEQAKHLKGEFDGSDYLGHYASADEVVVTIRDADLNAAMIARDGPAKPNLGCAFKCDWPNNCCQTKPAPSTAHPPIAGLMQENGFSHRLGSANLGKCA